MPCKHSYHYGCIKRWADGTHTGLPCCPLCKKKFRKYICCGEVVLTKTQVVDDDDEQLSDDDQVSYCSEFFSIEQNFVIDSLNFHNKDEMYCDSCCLSIEIENLGSYVQCFCCYCFVHMHCIPPEVAPVGMGGNYTCQTCKANQARRRSANIARSYSVLCKNTGYVPHRPSQAFTSRTASPSNSTAISANSDPKLDALLQSFESESSGRKGLRQGQEVDDQDSDGLFDRSYLIRAQKHYSQHLLASSSSSSSSSSKITMEDRIWSEFATASARVSIAQKPRPSGSAATDGDDRSQSSGTIQQNTSKASKLASNNNSSSSSSKSSVLTKVSSNLPQSMDPPLSSSSSSQHAPSLLDSNTHRDVKASSKDPLRNPLSATVSGRSASASQSSKGSSRKRKAFSSPLLLEAMNSLENDSNPS